MKRFEYVMKFTVLSIMAWCASLYAGVPEQLHYMVSPAGCMPATDRDADNLRFVNGVWILDSNATSVTAILMCPINFYGNVGDFNNIQLWYRANAPSPYSIVRARLMTRNRNAPGSSQLAVVSTENSNDAGYGFVNNNNVGAGPTTGNNFYLDVLLFRNSIQSPGDVAFIGLAIDIQ